MKTVIKSTIWILFFGLLSCKEVNSVKFHLDFIDSHTYYSEEIIPDDYLNIYGKWKLYKVSGGIHGTGHEPDYEYLEMKSFGIYGLIRNDNIFEYGKIKLDTFDMSTNDFLQVRFIPDYTTRVSTDIYPSEKYLYLKGTDSLDLISPCCDLYNYHYKRVK